MPNFDAGKRAGLIDPFYEAATRSGSSRTRSWPQVRPSTVRAQVKSMLAKTSTRRQAELVALLAHCTRAAR